jgi:hypothetical protein
MRKLKNIEGRFDCGLCPNYRGRKRTFASTGSLRNHQRKFHEKPREVGGKLSNANKEREDSLKVLKLEMRRLHKRNQKIAKKLVKVVKMLRKIS